MDEIINKVANSGLIQMDLADYKVKGQIHEIDLKNQLWQELILKEKDFRSWILSNDWSQFKDQNAFIHCSADAIIPTWAYMLVSVELFKVNCFHVVGQRIDLEKEIIKRNIAQLDLNPLVDGKIIVKGCSDITDPAWAMTEFVKKVQPIVKSIMFGEPCSTVPIYKRK
jgi:hypothetical protein